MEGRQRGRSLMAVVVLALLAGAGVARAQTPVTAEATAFNLRPTEQCPQPDIDRLQRVITFVREKSWAEDPGTTSFLINPDTAACRVVVKISEISGAEQAALERGGEGRLAIEKTRDKATPSRLPLVLWVIFGGAGVVWVFRRYGRR